MNPRISTFAVSDVPLLDIHKIAQIEVAHRFLLCPVVGTTGRYKPARSDPCWDEEGRGEVFIKTETETDFVVSYDDPLCNVTDICEENSPTCQNMPPDKKRMSFSSPIPPCSLNAYPSGSSANLETEFDLWARSVAHQLNNMDLKTALQLQLKMQQLLTEDRISQD
ncbi:hypothetical protein J6590_091668 [Homalodisca vitripennis]|nr:hypothetical protein J6590_091668 [Homalodisca vitripennis]